MSRTLCALVVGIALGLSCGHDDTALLREAQASIDAGKLEVAEGLLAQAPESSTSEMRAQIVSIREERTRSEREIARVLADAESSTPGQLRSRLDNLRATLHDPVAIEGVERTSRDLPKLLADRAADQRRAEDADQRDRTAALGAERMQGLRNGFAAAIAKRDWASGVTAIDKIEAEHALPPADIAAMRKQLADGSAADLEGLLNEVAALERRQSATAAGEFLVRELARFPDSPALDRARQLRTEIAQRAAAERARGDQPARVAATEGHATSVEPRRTSSDEAVGAESVPEGKTVGQLVTLATDSAARGELAFARECWLAASNKSFPGDWRDDYVGEAQDIHARLTLQDELTDAWKAAPNALAELGITAVDANGPTRNGQPAKWNEVTLDDYSRLIERFGLSKLARRGAVCEVLRSTSSDERERALVELARMSERGEIDVVEAANIVARARGGLGASERFQLEKGRWVARSAIEAAEQNSALAKLVHDFESAGPSTRDAAFDALLAGAGEEVLASKLDARTAEALATLKKTRTLEQLEALVELRRELDTARKNALDLIFDEKVYFYPYNPPEPPNTAGDYAKAQRRVDELVAAVRDVWGKKKNVHLPKEFRAALEEYAWCVRKHSEREIAIQPLPEYVLALPLDRDEVDLQSFAWNANEAGDFVYSRRVEARNEALWKQIDGDRASASGPAFPETGERDQVRITNAYRLMFGRRALAWNPKIQVAAQGHSDYMANTGDFGHFEKDPARHGPGDRMKLAGYTHGVSENCAMGGGDPQSAHDGWIHSSGHHRNILMPDHREMASAVAGFYWTQNFGVGTDFLAEVNKQGN